MRDCGTSWDIFPPWASILYEKPDARELFIMTTQDTTFTGVARPNRKVEVGKGNFWVYQVDIEGQFSEFELYDGNTLVTRENTSLELPAPIQVHELYIQIDSDQTCKYSILATPAKDLPGL